MQGQNVQKETLSEMLDLLCHFHLLIYVFMAEYYALKIVKAKMDVLLMFFCEL